MKPTTLDQCTLTTTWYRDGFSVTAEFESLDACITQMLEHYWEDYRSQGLFVTEGGMVVATLTTIHFESETSGVVLVTKTDELLPTSAYYHVAYRFDEETDSYVRTDVQQLTQEQFLNVVA